LDLFGGKKGSMTAFVVVAYMKSIPMIYGGQEVGTPQRLTFPFTSSKIDWSLNPDLTGEYKKIIAFRNSSEAVRRGEVKSYSSDDVCVFTKIIGAKKVLVLANLRNKPMTYTVPSELENSSWKDAFSGSKMKIPNTVTLEPYEYIVYKN
jgi:glycosidase